MSAKHQRVKCPHCKTVIVLTSIERMTPRKVARLTAELKFRQKCIREEGGHAPRAFARNAIGRRYGLTERQVAQAERTLL